MKKILAILLIMTLLFALCACGKTEDEDVAAVGEAEEQVICFVTPTTNMEFMQKHKKGFELACKALGVRGEYFGPADISPEGQANALEQAIALNPIAIITMPISDLSAHVEMAHEAGIPIIFVDIRFDSSNPDLYIGTSQYDLGMNGGKYLAKAIGGSGQVAGLMVAAGADSDAARLQGYQDALGVYPDIEIVTYGDTNTSVETATMSAASILQAHPDLAGFFCIDSTGGVGAATAVREAGLEDQVKIVALDMDSETLRLINEGGITATVAQTPEMMSFFATMSAFAMVNCVEPAGYPKSLATTIMPQIATSTFLIDSENVGLFID